MDILKNTLPYLKPKNGRQMNTISPEIITKTKQAKDYISVIENAVELYELYIADKQLEILKNDLFKKKDSNPDDVKIIAEINLVYKLQDLCKHRAG